MVWQRSTDHAHQIPTSYFPSLPEFLFFLKEHVDYLFTKYDTSVVEDLIQKSGQRSHFVFACFKRLKHVLPTSSSDLYALQPLDVEETEAIMMEIRRFFIIFGKPEPEDIEIISENIGDNNLVDVVLQCRR